MLGHVSSQQGHYKTKLRDFSSYMVSCQQSQQYMYGSWTYETFIFRNAYLSHNIYICKWGLKYTWCICNFGIFIFFVQWSMVATAMKGKQGK